MHAGRNVCVQAQRKTPKLVFTSLFLLQLEMGLWFWAPWLFLVWIEPQWARWSLGTNQLGWMLFKFPVIPLTLDHASSFCDQMGSSQESFTGRYKLEPFSYSWKYSLISFFRAGFQQILNFFPKFSLCLWCFPGSGGTKLRWNFRCGRLKWGLSVGRGDRAVSPDITAPTERPPVYLPCLSPHPSPVCPSCLPFGPFYQGTWLKVGE